MALKGITTRCWEGFCTRNLSFASSLSVNSRQIWRWEIVPCGSGVAGQQHRSLAKGPAADGGQKIATPNAAKAAKAKTSTKKEDKKEQRERFKDLIESCLKAKPAISVTKGKDNLKSRLRLLEKETIGTISPAVIEEIALERARAKAAKTAALAAKTAALAVKQEARKSRWKEVLTRFNLPEVQEGGVGNERAEAPESGILLGETGQSAETEVQIVEPEVQTAETKVQIVKPEIQLAEHGGEMTAEDLAKECSRMLLAEHRERAKGESLRLKMQKDAIAALPQYLREAALVPDLTHFPKNRIPASLTPPIRGYIDDRASAAAQAVTIKKSR